MTVWRARRLSVMIGMMVAGSLSANAAGAKHGHRKGKDAAAQKDVKSAGTDKPDKGTDATQDATKDATKDAKAGDTRSGDAEAAPKLTRYQDARDGAVDAGNLANLLEPLYSECKDPSDLARRRCEAIRAWHLDRFRTTRFVTTGGAASLINQPYDATEKSLTLVVTGCVACGNAPPEIAGSPRLVVSKPPKTFDGDAPVGLDLANYEVKLDSQVKAQLYLARTLNRLRVEYVFSVGAPFESGKYKGVTVSPLAYRVYNACTGEVVGSSLPSPAVLAQYARDPSCPALGAPTEEQVDEAKAQAALPDALARKDIEVAFAPAMKRIYECGDEFELKGNARVQIVLNPDARNPRFTILPPFDTGDAYLCIKVALREARFPRFKTSTGPQKFDYTFGLRR